MHDYYRLQNYKFQFHKGTIRTIVIILILLLTFNFNSIKVRLEPVLANIYRSTCRYFNSIKVRLEPNFCDLIRVSVSNFNSIKVRLELENCSNCYRKCEFQFHKGTIRTSIWHYVFVISPLFQFHKGTIRTSEAHLSRNAFDVFQFHKGTIRTINCIVCLQVLLNFNSIKVRLEHQPLWNTAGGAVISIP